MERLIAANTVAVGAGDIAPVTGTPGQASSGVPGTTPATTFPPYAWNMLCEEMRAVIVAAGITPSAATWTQLLAAIPLVALGGTAQSWQDVTGSRAFGTNFTNTTGRPIFINIYAGSTAATDHMVIYVSGVAIPGAGVQTSSFGQNTSVIVPAGAPYAVYWLLGSVTAFVWQELR